MLPRDLNLGIGYNNKVLVSNIGRIIGSYKEISKDHEKLPVTLSDDDALKMVKGMDKPIKDRPAVQHDNQKMLAKKHNDKKLNGMKIK